MISNKIALLDAKSFIVKMSLSHVLSSVLGQYVRPPTTFFASRDLLLPMPSSARSVQPCIRPYFLTIQFAVPTASDESWNGLSTSKYLERRFPALSTSLHKRCSSSLCLSFVFVYSPWPDSRPHTHWLTLETEDKGGDCFQPSNTCNFLKKGFFGFRPRVRSDEASWKKHGMELGASSSSWPAA